VCALCLIPNDPSPHFLFRAILFFPSTRVRYQIPFLTHEISSPSSLAVFPGIRSPSPGPTFSYDPLFSSSFYFWFPLSLQGVVPNPLFSRGEPVNFFPVAFPFPPPIIFHWGKNSLRPSPSQFPLPLCSSTRLFSFP